MHPFRVAIVVFSVLVGRLPAQMQLTLTDGTTTRGSLAGIAADGSWSWQGGGGVLKIPPAQIVSLDAGDGAQPPLEDGFRVDLVSGDSILARIEDGSADDVRLRAPAFGDVTFPLDDVAAIWNLQFPRAPESMPKVSGNAEMLYLDRDGRIDAIPGTLDKIGKSQLTFSSDAGKKRVFSFSRDRIVALKIIPRVKATFEDGSIVRLKDGSRLTGTLTPSDGASIAIKLSVGPSMVVDSRYVKSLALVNSSLRYLSDVAPAGFVETPLIGGSLPQGLQRDRGLKSGQPLRIGRRTFSKGLLVPAKSRVTYALDGGFTRFVATVGADSLEASELSGSVKASVLVDGKPVWTSAVLKAGQPPEAVDVTGLSGGRELAIEVDFADSFDAGARAVFGNAMLIK